MPLRPLLPAILLALVVSIIVGVLAAGRGSGLTLALAVALFGLQMLFATARLNAPFWRPDTTADEEPRAVVCAQHNAVLAALVYAWGAGAMLAIYSLTDLWWRHWWQYGGAMALLAAAIFLYAQLLSTGREPYRNPRALFALMALTAVQGIALTGVLVWLVLAGKLFTPRADWAANQIFTAGAAMLTVLSAVSILTYRRLARSKPQA